MGGAARGLDRVEDSRDALGEGNVGEADERLGDRLQRVADQPGVLADVGGQARTRQLARQRQRREEGRQHRRVADPAVEAQTDDRLHLLVVALGAHRIERPDALPVLRALHGARRAGAVAVGEHLLRLHAAPGLDGVAPVRRDLEEVRAVVVVEAQRRLGQPGR